MAFYRPRHRGCEGICGRRSNHCAVALSLGFEQLSKLGILFLCWYCALAPGYAFLPTIEGANVLRYLSLVVLGAGVLSLFRDEVFAWKRLWLFGVSGAYVGSVAYALTLDYKASNILRECLPTLTFLAGC